MTWPLLLASLWFVAANLVAIRPSHCGHRLRAYGLAACGVPVLGWLTLVHGPVVGGAALAVGAAVLRWPLLRLTRQVRALVLRQG